MTPDQIRPDQIRRGALISSFFLFTVVLVPSLHAQVAGTVPRPADGAVESPLDATKRLSSSPARIAATQKRREWLAEQLTARLHVQNKRDQKDQIAQMNAKLSRLSDQEIDMLAAATLEQLDKNNRRENSARALGELERAKALRDRLRRRVAASGGGAPGFYPMITWLPDGASLTASAVVSPDRRHVRINAMPFFSQVGPVHSFNFFTGQTRRLRQYDPPPPPPPAESWYDGLRTRSGRRR